MNKNEFLEKISKIIVNENKSRNNPLYPSVVIAQAILETGWGKSTIMMKANAIFGIKATKTWKGKVYNSKTKECYDGVKFTTITDCFRAYNSLEESIKDYFDLICKTSRYKKALNCKDYIECITQIKNGGYATDPNYITLVCDIINSNNLTKYDNVNNVENNVNNFYVVGKNYKLQVDLKVRSGAGINFSQKNYKDLTLNGKLHAYKKEKAILKKGTTVTCKKIIKNGNDIWLQIPSGYIAGIYNNNIYVK